MSTNLSKPQDQSIPTATDKANNSGNESTPAVAGTSKANSSIWQSYIDTVERQIKEEKNPARQENAEVVLKFVRQHGYPAQGYRFLAHHGIMEIWTDDDYPDNNEENLKLIGGSFKETYGLHYPWEISPRERE
ncbi:hypothetical protein J7T55_005149 [Diaporthe amygdali]|uniref:uncharacterized protein n=1 Tax=Phomopsis amygdali TaxID=1214568 RepID=UPI0022FF018F|nr:uncharacterized protein J7T55_005149 [Diaporthe amygdali]KAJ0116203.1 hypothetical protein J7T55_005149 [Diaporthe amygdali]